MFKQNQFGCGVILAVAFFFLFFRLYMHLPAWTFCPAVLIALALACLEGWLPPLMQWIEGRRRQTQINTPEWTDRLAEGRGRHTQINTPAWTDRLADVDWMDGHAFERYVGQLLRRQGFSTQAVGGPHDLGVDLVAKKGIDSYAVQVKRRNQPVSRRAVSDAVAAKSHYDCNEAMVVTNNYFSEGAKTLALSTGCELVDRDILARWIRDTP